jgi:hypothetical protein
VYWNKNTNQNTNMIKVLSLSKGGLINVFANCECARKLELIIMQIISTLSLIGGIYNFYYYSLLNWMEFLHCINSKYWIILCH